MIQHRIQKQDAAKHYDVVPGLVHGSDSIPGVWYTVLIFLPGIEYTVSFCRRS